VGSGGLCFYDLGQKPVAASFKYSNETSTSGTAGKFKFCWPCISSQILVNNQPDALFHVFIYSFHLSTCFDQVLIIGRSNCINTSTGMISLCDAWYAGPERHTKQSLTQINHTRWCINTIRSPDDEHLMLETCGEMKRINKFMKKCIGLVINKKQGISRLAELTFQDRLCSMKLADLYPHNCLFWEWK